MAFGDPSIFDIRETYREDTVGRKYNKPIPSRYNKKQISGKAKTMNNKSINLNHPVTMEELLSVSESTQRDYINNLLEKYNVGMRIVKMLGTNQAAYIKLLDRLGIPPRARQFRMSVEDIVRWEEFLGKRVIVEETPPTSSSVLLFEISGEYSEDDYDKLSEILLGIKGIKINRLMIRTKRSE